MDGGKLLALLAAILLVVWLVVTIRRQPAAFSKSNLSKSLSTLGVLGLGLIAFIAACVFLLRNS